MSKKEERILILSVKPFHEDEIAYKDIDVHMEDLPTRSEAVERMAKALYDLDKVRCSSDECPNEGPTCEGCPIWEKYEKMAKAALDALVGKNLSALDKLNKVN